MDIALDMDIAGSTILERRGDATVQDGRLPVIALTRRGDLKAKLAALPSDSERVKYLIDLSTATQKDNPKLALRFLEDARNLVSKRAANYRELEDLWRPRRGTIPRPADSKV